MSTIQEPPQHAGKHLSNMRFAPASAADLEALRPPTSMKRMKDAHAIEMGAGIWAVHQHDHWVPMLRSGGLWWTVADQGQALLWHANHWWWQTRDGWFLLHDGEPWAFRQFQDLKMQGFVHTPTGTRVVYSSDGHRAAITNTDGDTVVYDLETGAEIGRYHATAESADPGAGMM